MLRRAEGARTPMVTVDETQDSGRLTLRGSPGTFTWSKSSSSLLSLSSSSMATPGVAAGVVDGVAAGVRAGVIENAGDWNGIRGCKGERKCAK